MEYAAVVRALMAPRSILFFKNANRCTWLAEEQLAGDGQSHDTAADHEVVVFFQISSPAYPVVKIRRTRAKTCSSVQSGCYCLKAARLISQAVS